MRSNKPYYDVPGTTVFDADQARKGYHLNMFCMSLMRAQNRERFKEDERGYLAEWPMTEEQKQAVMARDYNRYHQALRYFADESVGFRYPDAYNQFCGADYQPLDYIRQARDEARARRWYMTSRLITIYDMYTFQDNWSVDPEQFTDVIGRHFKERKEGLGFDGSASAHMWRTMIWPNNFL
jgi:hypothetical protein